MGNIFCLPHQLWETIPIRPLDQVVLFIISSHYAPLQAPGHTVSDFEVSDFEQKKPYTISDNIQCVPSGPASGPEGQ